MRSTKPSLTYNCPEPSSSFIKGEKRDYCTKCNEQVYDLRSYSSFELRDFLNAQDGNVCGQVFADQTEHAQPAPTSLKWVAAGITSLLSLTMASNGISQELSPPIPVEQHDSTHYNQQQYISSSDSLQHSDDIKETEQPSHVYRRLRRTKVLFRVGERYLSVGTRFPFVFFRKRAVRRGRLVNCEPF